MPSDTSKRGSGLTRSTSSSSSRFSQPNQANLPSLKMLSERLGTTTSKSVPSALSEMSTNLPAEPTAGRLKLPASAVARAHLTPSAQVKPAEVTESVEPKEQVAESSTVATEQVAKDAAVTQKVESAAPAADTETADDSAKNTVVHKRVLENRQHARASLGVGYRPPTPETPQRNTKNSAGEDVPDIVVQSSTPGKGEDTDAAVEETTVTPSEAVKSHAAAVSKDELPLAHSWTLYYDSKTYTAPNEVVQEKLNRMSKWEASLLTVGEFNTVQSFARLMNNIRTPGMLAKGSNYHLFKDGIRPSWEDPANTEGGKWVLFTKTSELTDMTWSNLVMALVGEILDPDNSVTGIVVSPRPKVDRIQVWMRSKNDVHAVNVMGARIMETTGADARDIEMMSLEFQSNKSAETFPPSKFMRIPFTQRSVSAASSPGQGHRRLPGSPGGSSSPLAPSSPRIGARTLPLQRTNSSSNPSSLGPNNPFTGPMGAASRRLVSTPKDGGW